jgi:protein-S-isoprenylcysteine O-methyltransferase Ste14
MFERLLVWSLWLAWAAYWVATSRAVKREVRKESRVSRWGHMLPLMLGGWLLATPHLPRAWRSLEAAVIPWSPALYWGGVSMLALGLAFSVWARQHIGRNWSAMVTVKARHELVRSGPYAWVRHPIYTGLLAGFLGTAVLLDQWRGVLALSIALAALWRKLRLEERFMLETFGKDYADYRRRVRALVPGLL